MGTKSKLSSFLIIVFYMSNPCVAQQQDDEYKIKEIFINDVKMEHDDYRPFFKGKMIVDSIFWDDYNEENYRVGVYESDSLFIHLSAYDVSKLYCKYIEIFSSRYEIKFRHMSFRVGMDTNELEQIFPEMNLKKDYQNYIGKDNRHASQSAYFGLQMMVETNEPEVPLYPCQGLKFQILEGKIVSILVDFRTDGDF